jgi:hypothetical protein
MMKTQQANEKFPVGMIILLIFIVWTEITSLQLLFSPPPEVSASLTSGVMGTIMTVITIIVLAVICYGIVKRLAWARKLGIVWYIFSMLLIVFNLVGALGDETVFNEMLKANPGMSPSGFKTALMMGFGFMFIPDLIVINYLMRKKEFFVN